jgi:hypothetical protein
VFKLPCPWCGASLKTGKGSAGDKTKCPLCKESIHLLSTDDTYLQETFPFIKWSPCDDGRSSKEHVALARCGINRSAIFRIDDPVLNGWWEARRKGERPCRCMTIEIHKWEAERLGILAVLVDPLSFNPWCAANDCELMGWGGGKYSPWDDSEYKNHPGNPDVKLKRELMLVIRVLLTNKPSGMPAKDIYDLCGEKFNWPGKDLVEECLREGLDSGLWAVTSSGAEVNPFHYHLATSGR